MCIFNKETQAGATKIMVAHKGLTRWMAYQMKVTSKEKSMLLLPQPTHSIKFHDTTAYAEFLDLLAIQVGEKDVEDTRGMKGFTQVGAYQMASIKPEKLIDFLLEQEQTVPSWLYKMIKVYTDFTWLCVEIPSGFDMKSQPIMIEYIQNQLTDKLFLNMMEVHGEEEVEETADRDHVVIFANELITEKSGGFRLEIPNFPWNWGYIGATIKSTFNKRFKNGDLWVDIREDKDYPEEPGYTMNFRN
jgi:hypothetical protein